MLVPFLDAGQCRRKEIRRILLWGDSRLPPSVVDILYLPLALSVYIVCLFASVWVCLCACSSTAHCRRHALSAPRFVSHCVPACVCLCMSVCICLSVSSSMCLCMSLSLCVSLCLSIRDSLPLSVSECLSLYLCKRVFRPVYVPLTSLVSPSSSLSIYLHAILDLCLPR